jgi:hypothetical protein
MRRNPLTIDPVILHQQSEHGRDEPRIRARFDGEVVVCLVGGFASSRVDDDQRAFRVLGDPVNERPRPRETVRLPWILAEEDRHFTVLEIAVCPDPQHLARNPELARLLLCQCIRTVTDAERFQPGLDVCAAEMIALTATAVIEDLVAAELVADGMKASGNLGNRRIPVNRLVAAVRLATHRRRQPVGAVLVEVQALRLLAHVAL